MGARGARKVAVPVPRRITGCSQLKLGLDFPSSMVTFNLRQTIAGCSTPYITYEAPISHNQCGCTPASSKIEALTYLRGINQKSWPRALPTFSYGVPY